ALQALLLYIQNKQLKARKNSHFLKALPPLLTMETILFALIRAGFVLLTLAIVSGAIFIQDLLAQHLVHKTALSLFAWLVFAILLIGHHFYGWRGLIASRWTLGGAIVLMLGFLDRKSTRLNSSHVKISYAVFCLKKKKTPRTSTQRNLTLLKTKHAE